MESWVGWERIVFYHTWGVNEDVHSLILCLYVCEGVCVCVIASKSSPFTYRCITRSQLQQRNKYSRKMTHEGVTFHEYTTQTHDWLWNFNQYLLNALHALCVCVHTCMGGHVQATVSIGWWRCFLSTSSMSLSSAMIPRGAVRLALTEIVAPTGEDSLTYPW